jgi:hypothetical protein
VTRQSFAPGEKRVARTPSILKLSIMLTEPERILEVKIRVESGVT